MLRRGVLKGAEVRAEDGVDSGALLGSSAGENGFLTEEGPGKAASGPTEAGYYYVMPANINPADQETWKKSENQVAASKCLHVSSVTRTKVREGSCMEGGARSSSRVFKLVNTSAADEYGIRSVWNTCWQPEAKAGGDDAEAAADGVHIISVSNASGCGGVLQSWRIEPVDPAAASR